MATLAAFFRRMPAISADGAASQPWMEEMDPYVLRPLPCEDVYFYCKKINNSKIVREADPHETRRAFHVIAAFSMVFVIMVVMLAPKGLGLAAGYRLEALKAEHSRLVDEKAALELEEARLLSPQKLEELAKTLKFEEPGAGQVHVLNPQASDSVAWNLHGKKR